MISYLGGAGGLYQELEQKILEECPEAEVVLAGSRVEKSSFRLYRRKKFIAYCNVHDGFFDMMTRLSAREAERAEAVAAGIVGLCAGGMGKPLPLRRRRVDSLSRPQQGRYGRGVCAARHQAEHALRAWRVRGMKKGLAARKRKAASPL